MGETTEVEASAMAGSVFMTTQIKIMVGLIILFCNFDGSNYDLYDVIVKWLGG